MLIRKEVIGPGTYWYVDKKTNQPAKFVATPDFCKYWYDCGSAMLSSGLSIPVPLEHQDEASPLTPSQRAAKLLFDNAGWVNKFELDKDSRLFSILDIQDPEVAKKLPTTIRWTSPWINTFTDGNGKTWQNAISHLALTSRPRITKQEPFPSIAAAMSLFSSITPSTKPQGFALSRAGLITPQGLPAYPLAFSLWSGGIKLGPDEMSPKKAPPKKEEKDKKPPTPPDTEQPDAPTPPDGAATGAEGLALDSLGNVAPQLEQQLVDTDGDISVYSVLKDLLSVVGVELPDDTDESNFRQNLYMAVMEKVKGMKPETEMNATTPPPEAPAPKTPPVQETQPMYMSLEQVNAIVDPEKKQMASMLFSLQQQNDKNSKRIATSEKAALDEAGKRRQARIDRLLKRSPDGAFREKLIAKANSIKLSVNDEGQVVDPLADMLDMLETGLKDLPALLTVPGHELSIQNHPADFTGQMTEEKRQAVVRELETSGGLNHKK